MKTRFLLIITIVILGTLQLQESFSEEPTASGNIGKIKWYEQNLHSKIPVYSIQVTDSDMNLNSNKIDKFGIHISSDSDPVGIIVIVYETERNSGIFDSTVYFSEDFSTGQRLITYDGDTVTAKYEDHTLPPPYSSDEKLKILDSIIIRKTLANLDESQNQFIRIDDELFNRQSLQTVETISASGTFTSIIVGSLGPILIVLFIVIYAVKKRMKKSIEERKC